MAAGSCSRPALHRSYCNLGHRESDLGPLLPVRGERGVVLGHRHL